MNGASLKRMASEGSELTLVLIAAAVGLVLAAPIRALVDHGAINAVLFVLVLSAAMTLPLSDLTDLRSRLLRLTIVAAATVIGLPVIVWSAAQLVPEGPVRLGIICLAVAPAEIATVALATVAAGETAVAAYLLVVSTVATAVLAAPLLGLLAGGGSVRSGELILTLVLVVILPFVIGIGVRTRLDDRVEKPAGTVATGAVTVLVALVASQVTLEADLARAALALCLVVVASAMFGIGLGRLVPAGDRSALLLSVSMRDFAVAAGIASAAFGPGAAAPLGLYGIIVMILGTVVASRARQQSRRS